MDIDLTKDALGQDREGNDVFLGIFGLPRRSGELVEETTRQAFLEKYADVFG